MVRSSTPRHRQRRAAHRPQDDPQQEHVQAAGRSQRTGGYVDYYYLDPTTYLPMRWEGNRLIAGRMQTFVSDYLEYKTFGGYPFPSQIITESPDGNAQAILIDDSEDQSADGSDTLRGADNRERQAPLTRRP